MDRDQDAAGGQGGVGGELSGRRSRRAAELRCFSPEVEEASRLVADPLPRERALLVAVLGCTQSVEGRGRRKGRAALGDSARQHFVPTRRTVPCVDVGALREELQLGRVALAPRERKRFVDGVEKQLGEVQGGLRALREFGAEPMPTKKRTGKACLWSSWYSP